MKMTCQKCQETFITDRAELCDKCPIHQKVDEVFNKTELKFKLLRESLNKEEFKATLRDRISEGNRVIKETLKYEPDGIREMRPNRIALVMSWKKSIRYFEELLNDPRLSESSNLITLLNQRNEVLSLLDREEEKDRTKFLEIKSRLNEFATGKEKIEFLKNERRLYWQNLTSETMYASGIVVTMQGEGEKFLDRMITQEIEMIAGKYSIELDEQKNVQVEPEIKLSEIFTKPKKWRVYIDPLTKCTPALLELKKGKYHFIGNAKIHRGCVAAWFKGLKAKSIIDVNLNRDQLAEILSREIGNFTISGSSIDNDHEGYKRDFESQLNKLLKQSN